MLPVEKKNGEVYFIKPHVFQVHSLWLCICHWPLCLFIPNARVVAKLNTVQITLCKC